jgi:tetratricopeptide (TPR) repeat protein
MDPPNSKVWYEAACLAEEMTEYDLAQVYLQRALQLDPMNTLIFSKKAEILSSLKRYSQSIQTLMEALTLCQLEQ